MVTFDWMGYAIIMKELLNNKKVTGYRGKNRTVEVFSNDWKLDYHVHGMETVYKKKNPQKP